jgi:hypothetical protein
LARPGGGDAGAWRSILIGVAASGAIIGLAVAVTVGTFIVQHHDSEYVAPTAAEAEFDRDRRRFADKRPLVDVRDGADPVPSRPKRFSTEAESAALTRTLHTVVFESRSGRLVRINLPFRIVRLLHPNGITYLGELAFFEDTEFDSDRVLLALDDLEPRGPTLIVDHRHPGGGQFLVWVE